MPCTTLPSPAQLSNLRVSDQTAPGRELLGGLTAHLKPAPHPFGTKALQLLGKLGGRNRRHLKVRQDLGTHWARSGQSHSHHEARPC